jgi:hypothetical protein
MERKLLLILVIVVLLVLAAVFYPKHCGNWGTAIGGAEYMDCDCIGLKVNEPLFGPRMIGGGSISCYGIPTSYSCYKNEFGDEKIQKIDIPCE